MNVLRSMAPLLVVVLRVACLTALELFKCPPPSPVVSCSPTDSALQPGTVRRLLKGSNGNIYLITDKGYKRGFASATFDATTSPVS